MVLTNRKLIIGLLILTAFVGIGVFGLAAGSHLPGTPMPDCPYAPGGFALCADTLQHIANWQEFSSIVVPFVFVLLVLAGATYFLNQNLLNPEQRSYRRKNLDAEKYFYTGTILKWLSLLENSPSLARFRHS